MRRYSLLFLLFLFSCGSQKIANYEQGNTRIDSTQADGGLEDLIEPYRTSMDKEMNKVIGVASVDLEKGNPESPLGNFAAEAAYQAGLKYGLNSRALDPNIMKRSFALLNVGGLRAPINKGEITLGNIYELMPFDNTLILVKLSADQAKLCARYLYDHNGQPIFNARFELTSTTEKAWIGGEEYNFDEDIVIITSDYLASGGDKMNFFKEPILKYDSGKFLRDVFIEYVVEKQELGEYKNTGKFNISRE